ncbi:MAG: hypothetical protein ACOCUT_01350, partial [bacterium]
DQSIIETFYAPYYCKECDKEEQVLLKATDMHDKDEAPSMKCSSCKKEMEFDDIEEQYFGFLK